MNIKTKTSIVAVLASLVSLAVVYKSGDFILEGALTVFLISFLYGWFGQKLGQTILWLWALVMTLVMTGPMLIYSPLATIIVIPIFLASFLGAFLGAKLKEDHTITTPKILLILLILLLFAGLIFWFYQMGQSLSSL